MEPKRRISLQGLEAELEFVSINEGGGTLHVVTSRGRAMLRVAIASLDGLTDAELEQLALRAFNEGTVFRSLRPLVALTGRARLAAQPAVLAKRYYFEALTKQKKFLYDYLERVRAGDADYCLPLSGRLRALLCDKKHPVLLAAADAVDHRLTLWGPPAVDPNRSPNQVWRGELAAWDPPVGPSEMREYEIRDYLDTPIGVVDSLTYTPRQLVLWMSQKEGEAHFDPDKPGTLRRALCLALVTGPGYRNEVERGVVKLSEWALLACEGVLAYLSNP